MLCKICAGLLNISSLLSSNTLYSITHSSSASPIISYKKEKKSILSGSCHNPSGVTQQLAYTTNRNVNENSDHSKAFFQIWHLLYSDYIETSSLNIFLISPLHPKQRATLWVIFFRPRGTFWPGAAPVVDISTQNLIKPAHQPCRPLHLSNNKHVRAFSLHSRWFFITQTCILKMTCDLCLFDLVCVCVCKCVCLGQ